MPVRKGSYSNRVIRWERMSSGIEELVLDWITMLAHFSQYGGGEGEKVDEISLIARMSTSSLKSR